MEVIFKFVGKENNIKEQLVSFLICSYELGDKQLYRTMKEFLDSIDIDNADCREEGYGWVEAVAGKNQ